MDYFNQEATTVNLEPSRHTEKPLNRLPDNDEKSKENEHLNNLMQLMAKKRSENLTHNNSYNMNDSIIRSSSK